MVNPDQLVVEFGEEFDGEPLVGQVPVQARGDLVLFEDPVVSARRHGGRGRVVSTHSAVLYEALIGLYGQLGFDGVGDEVFRDLVIARIVEPTSLRESVRVLGELGRDPASYSTMKRTLGRVVVGGYRDLIAAACFAHVAAAGTSRCCSMT